MIFIYTWNNKWIQDNESLWGIVEKFKLANVITGNGFFYSFCINSKAKFKKNYEGQSSLNNLKNLSIDKLNDVFKIDFENYINDFLKQFSIFKFKIPRFHNTLFFCDTCIAKGFHSLFHQLMILENCPYHPEKKITNKCPNCNGTFRYYNFGAFEKPFHCESCNQSILDSEDFISNSNNWGKNFELMTPIQDKLNIKSVEDSDLYFVYTINHEIKQINTAYAQLVDLLNMDYKQTNIPYSTDKSQLFQQRYQDSKKIMLGYNLKSLIPDYTPIITDTITTCLNIELFNQSKAILKSVERYILKQFDRKTITEIKKCYGSSGYKAHSKFKSPFIEWKNECYGNWIYNIEYEKYNSFNYNIQVGTNEKQVFPYLYHMQNFRRNLMQLNTKIDSFSLLLNLFSKLLFMYLYERFLEIKNPYIEDKKVTIRPHVIIKQNGRYVFN